MFEDILLDYENELALFEEIAFSQFVTLEDYGFTTLQDQGLATAGTGGIDSFVDLDESALTSLNKQAFAELRLATTT